MSKTIQLFVPCLMDQVYPEMGEATLRVLRRLGYSVNYDPEVVCCGQPAFNAGHREDAVRVASQFVGRAPGQGALVCPSGSCAAMVRVFYPKLFADGPQQAAAENLGRRFFELSEFLVQQGELDAIQGQASGKVAFHNSCHSLRELRIADAPMKLLRRIAGIELVEPPGEPACCGFGGLFSVKFSAIASGMAQSRLEPFLELGVQTLVSNDAGCVMHLRRECRARGYELEVLHLAEFLCRAMELGQESADGLPRAAATEVRP